MMATCMKQTRAYILSQETWRNIWNISFLFIYFCLKCERVCEYERREGERESVDVWKLELRDNLNMCGTDLCNSSVLLYNYLPF